MCFVKGNNFTVHNFFKGQVISDVFWPTMYQIIKKTMRANGHVETIPFNCFSVEGTKINKNQ